MEVAVVVTAHDQREQVAEAVASVRAQTAPCAELVVVDDGSTDAASLAVLDRLRADGVRVLRQDNAGVSAARNAGIAATRAPLVLVLDGDDRLATTFLARVAPLLADPDVVAASSWLALFGVASGAVRPGGGDLVDFLHRNACPGSAVLRRGAWERAGGYDEAMRTGFEDWDLYLGMLAGGGRVAIAPEPLLEYRTAPASANVRSMTRRLALFRGLVDKHRAAYVAHLADVLVALEATAVRRLGDWEALVAADPALPLVEPTFGDGGMAAHVRVATAHGARAARAAREAPAERVPDASNE
ncbi:glycosyltransferase family A protein [Cellulomonas sp. Y8]|uniref:glycosyltransferase family 2 protein n=1 Tax=Cellulomonas sp. Y8 TaxID=2591145 RepID=UPI0011C9C676|nr:glycosyltransferase family A protein [Cellulomonas sp. Y8]